MRAWVSYLRKTDGGGTSANEIRSNRNVRSGEYKRDRNSGMGEKLAFPPPEEIDDKNSDIASRRHFATAHC